MSSSSIALSTRVSLVLARRSARRLSLPPPTTHPPTTATCRPADSSTVSRTSRCLAACSHDPRGLQQLTSQGRFACRFGRSFNRSRPIVQHQMYSPYSISVFKFSRGLFRRAGRRSQMINEQVCALRFSRHTRSRVNGRAILVSRNSEFCCQSYHQARIRRDDAPQREDVYQQAEPYSCPSACKLQWCACTRTESTPSRRSSNKSGLTIGRRSFLRSSPHPKRASRYVKTTWSFSDSCQKKSSTFRQNN